MRRTVLFIFPDSRIRVAARMALEDAGHIVQDVPRVPALDEADLAAAPDLIAVPWEHFALAQAYAQFYERWVVEGGIAVVVLAHPQDIKPAIACLDLGADDCLTLPFAQEELVTRVQACLRRRGVGGSMQRQIIAGPLVLDKVARSLAVDSQLIQLAPVEFKLMTFFMENQGAAFTRGELLGRLWTSDNAAERTIDVHVRRLRRVLEPYGCDGMIQTVRKFGYRFSLQQVRQSARPSGRRWTSEDAAERARPTSGRAASVKSTV